jgi:murein DD-endopeptidase MepM/ murein hydrolase activator NlpD
MLHTRYTISIASGTSDAVRRFSLRLWVAVALAAAAVALPSLMVFGARLSASAELSHLYAQNAALRLENESYRAATGQLTDQIAALQGVVVDLGERSKLDPAAAAAIGRLPKPVQGRATGGAAVSPEAARTLLSAAVTSPENTFGVLRDLLSVLETRLQSVRGDVERWQALGRATPSIWPALGWLTDGFGRRTDPFTGDPAQHLGLDIAADKGQPVYATADGVIESAAWANDFGNLVVIGHEFGLATRYAHLSRFVVRAGQRVARGEVIGYIGSTGRSSGPHLHYEVWANGAPINPLQLLTASTSR